MKAGALNRKVTIQRRDEGKGAWGEPTGSWVDVVSVWANVRNLSGAEAIKAGAESSAVKASIRIRYRTNIDAGMRVVCGLVTYNVLAVLPDEVGRDHTDLVCEMVK